MTDKLAGFSNRQNAVRACKRQHGTSDGFEFSERDGRWYFDAVPAVGAVPGEEDAAAQRAADAAAFDGPAPARCVAADALAPAYEAAERAMTAPLEVLTEAERAEQHAAEETAREEEDAEAAGVEDEAPDDGLSRDERNGVDPALIYGEEEDEDCDGNPDPAEQHERDTFVPKPEPVVSDQELVTAAVDQAGIFDKAGNPAVAWLLRSLAARLQGLPVEAPTVPLSRAAALQIASPRPPRAPRASRVERDWTVKPVITSVANAHVQKLIDRIDASRGDAEALRAFTFKRSSTYYVMAGRFLDALLDEAEAPSPAGGEG